MTDTLVASLRAEEPLRALTALADARTALDVETTIQVRRARHQGCSWEEIAAALGVSRQAVHKKYAGRGRLRRRSR
jgi:DNA-directed RNA polymerase specialized sigma24 family protein